MKSQNLNSLSAIKITNKNSLLWLGLLLSILLFFSFSYVFAVGDSYFPQDTTVNLTIDGASTNYTIVGESEANQVTVNTSSITVNISSGQTFKFRSYDADKLTNDAGLVYSCSGGESQLTVTVSSTKDVVISPDASACTSGGGGGCGAGGGVGGSTSTTTTTSTPVPTSTSAPAVVGATPVSRGFVSLAALTLKEGDVVSAAGSDDPDVYIVNSWGYKRLFLNPVIFGFYGHLGGFSKVKNTASSTRDTLVTSGLFRNCETNDVKVYGVETTGDDTGTLHWVNTTGEQAVADDSEFFKKVFCINNNEFVWYKQGTAYTSVNQIPAYTRSASSPSPPVSSPASIFGKVKVVSSVDWLNVRASNSTSSAVVTKVLPGEEFNFIDLKDNWYKIQKDGKDLGWVFGVYVVKL